MIINSFKKFLREKYEWLLDPIHFGVSLDRLRVLEEHAYQRDRELFYVPFEYVGAGHYKSISPSQVVEEIRALYEMVCELRPRIVCEIGTDKGGTFYLWCQASDPKALLLSLDLPSRKRYSMQRRRLYAQFRQSKSQTMHFVPGDSHSESTKSFVEGVLAGRKIDFLFIDGDHTYDGVKKDYEMYAEYVRSGGLIAFHDIRTVRPGCGVKDFWDELVHRVPPENRWEFTQRDCGPTGAGIAVIRVL